MKPDFYVIARDTTEYWNLTQDDPDHVVTKVESVYLFDKNQVTRLCEFTPSYCLYHVEDRVTYADGTPDETINRIDSVVMGESGSEVEYFHCQDVDRLLGKVPTYHYGSPYKRGQNGRNVGYEAALEGVLEYVKCNAKV